MKGRAKHVLRGESKVGAGYPVRRLGRETGLRKFVSDGEQIIRGRFSRPAPQGYFLFDKSNNVVPQEYFLFDKSNNVVQSRRLEGQSI